MGDAEILEWKEAPDELRSELVRSLKRERRWEAFRLLGQHRNVRVPKDFYLTVVPEKALEARDSFFRLIAAVNYSRTPCPYCGEPLRSPLARQCFTCGADWHSTINATAKP
jgi:hypothetical protein